MLQLDISIKRKPPVLLQANRTECAAVCLTMAANYFGNNTTVKEIRSLGLGSTFGCSLSDVSRAALVIKIMSRPIAVSADDLADLKVPTILHFDNDHFVLLSKVSRQSITVNDPSCGEITLSKREFSYRSSGYGLELWPGQNFEKTNVAQNLRPHKSLGTIHGSRKLVWKIILISVGIEALGLLLPLFSEWVLDLAIPSSDTDLLFTLSISFFVVVIVQQFLNYTRSWCIIYLSNSYGIQWKSRMFSHILKLNYSFFSGRLFGDVLSRFESLDEIIKVVTSVFLISYIDGVMALFTMAMMFAYSWKLALLSCVSLIFYALLRTVRVAPLHGATAQQIALKARQETHLMETVRGLRTIKLFQEETLRLREWINIATAQLNASGRLSNASEFYQVLSGSLTGTERIGIVWWGAAMVIHGDFSVGGLVAFLAYREQADKRIVNVIDAVSKTRLLQMHLRRVVEITSEEPEENRLLIQNGSRSGDKEFREIRAENIAFRYSSDDKYILKGVDLRLSRLDSVAIIGPSGSGKTTLAQILAGLLRPSLGQVVLDGRVCVSSALPELRDICGTVMQDDYLFNGTIIENVSFFEDRPDLERVTECLSTACIVDEVNDMPAQGYTRVGDMGSTLSGGQRQRILLARALYRKPAILILDEATSQLDIATERRVVNNIKALGLARICVAHRYETIKSCERFLSLSGGKIIRRGAVEELERPVA